ncbi:hypothetical protein PC116_g33036 [Phytophthora cactorum]|nr:hypothetical protein PC116_g33036 [Phytophthora cactorum]
MDRRASTLLAVSAILACSSHHAVVGYQGRSEEDEAASAQDANHGNG